MVQVSHALLMGRTPTLLTLSTLGLSKRKFPLREDIADQAINEDGSLSLPFNVGGSSFDTSVTATSSNTTLVPNNPVNISDHRQRFEPHVADQSSSRMRQDVDHHLDGQRQQQSDDDRHASVDSQCSERCALVHERGRIKQSTKMTVPRQLTIGRRTFPQDRPMNQVRRLLLLSLTTATRRCLPSGRRSVQPAP